MSKVMCECPKCGKEFQLGVNGAYIEKRKRYECDQCSGVSRDKHGHAWTKGERFHHHDNGDGTTERVERHQAFRR